MPVEAVDAGNFPAGDRFSEPREAGGVMFARHGRMVQMKRDGAPVDKFAPAAQMIKPCADVGILARAPAGVVFVEAVHGQNILAPERHVAADDATLVGVAPNDWNRPANALDRTGDFSGEHPAPCRGLARLKFGDKFFADKTTPALHPATRLGQRRVVGDKFRMRHAIAVGKNQIIAAHRQNRFIEDDGLVETIVRMPDMFDRYGRTGGKFFYKFARHVIGAVVGD